MSKEPDVVRREIVESALTLLGDAELEQVFKALTPELIAEDAPWAASTVRYQFGLRTGGDGRGRLAFQRRDLALAMLEAALEDAVDASAGAAVTYHDAAEELPVSGSMEGVLAAIAANLSDFIPGASTADVSPRERMYLLAVAMCDADPDAARLLREARARQISRYLPMYESFLEALGRELRPDRTLEELANAIYALLDGHLLRLRFDPRTPADWVGETVLAIFQSFTVRRGEDPRDIASELLG